LRGRRRGIKVFIRGGKIKPVLGEEVFLGEGGGLLLSPFPKNTSLIVRFRKKKRRIPFSAGTKKKRNGILVRRREV